MTTPTTATEAAPLADYSAALAIATTFAERRVVALSYALVLAENTYNTADDALAAVWDTCQLDVQEAVGAAGYTGAAADDMLDSVRELLGAELAMIEARSATASDSDDDDKGEVSGEELAREVGLRFARDPVVATTYLCQTRKPWCSADDVKAGLWDGVMLSVMVELEVLDCEAEAFDAAKAAFGAELDRISAELTKIIAGGSVAVAASDEPTLPGIDATL